MILGTAIDVKRSDERETIMPEVFGTLAHVGFFLLAIYLLVNGFRLW